MATVQIALVLWDDFEMRAFSIRLCLIGLFLSFSSTAQAHPHAWVDVKVQILFDDMQRAYAIKQEWLFDDLYSVFVTSGADMDGDGRPDQEALDAVMKENIENLREFEYFTDIKSGEMKIQSSRAIDVTTRMEGKRLQMTFTLPFNEPVAVTDMPLQYAIYDPTYYVEMVHAEVDDAITMADAPEACRAVLEQPNPDPNQVIIASSLSQTQTAGDGLGQYFAEKVSIVCS
jgi:ABC-type uncharacterized transport system substrate-binding protein